MNVCSQCGMPGWMTQWTRPPLCDACHEAVMRRLHPDLPHWRRLDRERAMEKRRRRRSHDRAPR